MKIISFVPVSGNLYSITLDDGPTERTRAMLDLLAKHNAKATFFVVGQHALRRASDMLDIVKEGHEVGVYAFTHGRHRPDMSFKEASRMLLDTIKAVQDVCGVTPLLYRPTHGRVYPAILKACEEQGLLMAGWSAHARDWARGNCDGKSKWLVKQVVPGSVVMIHEDNDLAIKLLSFALESLSGLVSVTMLDLIKNEDRSLAVNIDGVEADGCRVGISLTQKTIEVFLSVFWAYTSLDRVSGVKVQMIADGQHVFAPYEVGEVRSGVMSSWKQNFKFRIPSSGHSTVSFHADEGEHGAIPAFFEVTKEKLTSMPISKKVL